jgi:hypothetical protein
LAILEFLQRKNSLAVLGKAQNCKNQALNKRKVAICGVLRFWQSRKTP